MLICEGGKRRRLNSDEPSLPPSLSKLNIYSHASLFCSYLPGPAASASSQDDEKGHVVDVSLQDELVGFYFNQDNDTCFDGLVESVTTTAETNRGNDVQVLLKAQVSKKMTGEKLGSMRWNSNGFERRCSYRLFSK